MEEVVTPAWRRALRQAAVAAPQTNTSAATATALILTRGAELGMPLMVVGAKLTATSDRVRFEGVETLAPMVGELEPRPTPVAREARKRRDVDSGRVARR